MRERGALLTLVSAQMDHRAWLWYSQPHLASVCYPLSTQEKPTEWISPRSCSFWSESIIHLRLPNITLAVPSDRCCIFAHPPSSSVPCKPNTSLHCGGPLPLAIVDALADPWLSAQGPHHVLTKGTLRRQAHSVPQVNLNVSVHQADLQQAPFSMWPTSCIPHLSPTPPTPLPQPSLAQAWKGQFS